MSKTIASLKYRKLIVDILSLYENIKKSLALFYWKIGQRIVEGEQNGEVKAAYGSGLLEKISDDLIRACGPNSGFSIENLRRMRRFYLTHPNQSISTDLNWSQYVALLPVKDERLRARLEQRAAREGLIASDIRKLVQKTKTGGKTITATVSAKTFPPLKPPTDLKLQTYQKVLGNSIPTFKVPDDVVILDCGFFVCHAVTKEEAALITLTDKPSYTYAATVGRVVDGDTLLVVIELGFNVVVREKLRLRGIDTPELGTPEGEKAKKFVAKLLPAGSRIILKSHQTDIYGRFVADVFYMKSIDDPQKIINEGVYLNQQLLDEGYAVRMEE
jgi:endonuclease YncB( thermonuclease family)